MSHMFFSFLFFLRDGILILFLCAGLISRIAEDLPEVAVETSINLVKKDINIVNSKKNLINESTSIFLLLALALLAFLPNMKPPTLMMLSIYR